MKQIPMCSAKLIYLCGNCYHCVIMLNSLIGANNFLLYFQNELQNNLFLMSCACAHVGFCLPYYLVVLAERRA